MGDSIPPRKILLALPENWKIEICQFLSSKGLQVVQASTVEDALEIIQSQDFQGMIIVSDWLTSKDGKSSALMEMAPKDVPMLMLIRDQTDYSWFQFYQPRLREYCTIPFGFDELNLFLQLVGIIS